jgi:hypothetical protein
MAALALVLVLKRESVRVLRSTGPGPAPAPAPGPNPDAQPDPGTVARLPALALDAARGLLAIGRSSAATGIELEVGGRDDAGLEPGEDACV